MGTLKEHLHLTSSTKNSSSGIPRPDSRPAALQTFHNNTPLSQGRRANATFVFLCRNGDIDGVIRSIQSMEDRFNKYDRAFTYGF